MMFTQRIEYETRLMNVFKPCFQMERKIQNIMSKICHQITIPFSHINVQQECIESNKSWPSSSVTLFLYLEQN